MIKINSIFAILLSVVFIGTVSTQWAEPTPQVVTNIELGKLECEGGAHAEGIARAEYSMVSTWQDDARCSLQGPGAATGGTAGTGWNLIQKANGQTNVNAVTILAWSTYPRGATAEYREFSLITSGPLQGKFLMAKSIYRQDEYLKKCSSQLGDSLVINKPINIVIFDKPDVNALIDPLGGFEIAKREAQLVCQGQSAII